MRRRLSLALGSLLFIATALLRAGDPPHTPEQVGTEMLDKFHEVGDLFHDQVSYVKGEGSEIYFSADALWLRRDLTRLQLPTTSFGVGGPIIAQLQDLHFVYEAGLQMTAGYRCDPWWSVEGTYFGLQQWNDVVTVNDPQGRLFGVLNKFGTVQQPIFPSPPLPPTFGTGNNTTSQSGGYSSRINNFEVNVVRDLLAFNLSANPDGAKVEFAALAGARYLRLVENFFVATSGDIIPLAGINDPSAFANYNIDVENNLFGGQIGGRMTMQMERLTLGVESKVALLADGAKQRSSVVFHFAQPLEINGQIPGGASDLRSSVLGQIDTTADYDLTSHIRLRAGFEVMWLNGRALAPDQIDGSVAQTNMLRPILNNRGTTRYYGSFGGVEIHF